MKTTAIKHLIKRNPWLYSFAKQIRSLIRHVNRNTLRANVLYYKAILLKRPYFGRKYGASMMADKEVPVLRNVADYVAARSPAICLEIGSWAGYSTTIIAGSLKKAGKGTLFCVDTWQGTPGAPIAKNGVAQSTIFKLFLRNIKYSGLKEYVRPITSSSDEFTQNALRHGNQYDLIFIDGDHRYSQVRADITNCLKLVKMGGIICGDDLEFFLHETDETFTRDNCEKDFAVDPQGKAYHPGVTLAIKDVLHDRVGLRESIWAIQKTTNGFIPFDKLLES